MCPDNPTIQPDPGAVAQMVNEEIGAFVQREIFDNPKFRALRMRYPGVSDKEILKAVVLQTHTLIYLDIQPTYNRLVFLDEEFAR